MAHPARTELRNARRLVIKIGTAVATRDDGHLALGRLGALVEQLHELRQQGREVLLVSSGAIGLGVARLGLDRVPSGVVDRQACAAAGQGALMALYDTLLRQLGETGAQVLLTEQDFLHRRRYVNLHAALERLLELGAVPVINENDTVSTAELELGQDKVFGDNDRLSALVAAGVDAQALVLLTDVDSVYTAPPGTAGAERISVFEPETAVSLGDPGARGRGGMQSKLAAAAVATRSGTPVVIASGLAERTLTRLTAGEDIGTVFPARVAFNKRRQWLAYATSPVGRLVVNEGARVALVDHNASLLAAGVIEVQGEFEEGAIVAVVSESGLEFARGICTRAARDIRATPSNGAKGRALIHRDNAVILYGEPS